MSATGAGYDLSVTTFSPDGRVFQVEYASKAVEKSGTAVGIRCVDGVVLGVEKLILSKMLVPGTSKRIHSIDYHCGLAMAGLSADAKQLVNRGRSEARGYREFYGHPIPGTVLNERISGFVHLYTLYWYLRPFGASVLLASFDDDNGPKLHMIEPAGVSYSYFGCAIGKAKSAAKAELEKINFKTITCKEAVMEAARIIYKLHDDVKDKEFELEMSWVCEQSNRKHVPVPKELFDVAVKAAVEAKEKEEHDYDDDKKESKKDDKSTSSSTSTSTSTSSPTTTSKPAAAADPAKDKQ